MKRHRRPRRKNKFVRGIILILLVFVAYTIYHQTTSSSPTKILGIRELPPNFKSHGIDISRYQGEVDWDVFFEKSDSIISFVYCKATEGVSHIDERFATNVDALRNRNKAFGVYHFFVPSSNAQSQANHFLKQYSPRANELPPVLDVESESVSDAKLITGMKEWLEIVEKKTGKRPIIYTSFHFYKTKFKNKFKNYQFWIANYSDRKDRMINDQIIHWQYSDKGVIPGIEGTVDLNFSKQEFN